MAKIMQQIQASTSKATPSAFVRPSLKRGMAVLGTTGLVLGMGVAATSSASATTAPFACTDANRAVAGGTPEGDGGDLAEIQTTLDSVTLTSGVKNVCLSGTFLLGDDAIDDSIDFGSDVHFFGEGEGTTSIDGFNFFSTTDSFAVSLYSITIENLSIKNSVESAVSALDVTVIDSIFSNNQGFLGGAISAYGLVTVTDSTFIDNSAFVFGGAIMAWSEVENPASVVVSNSSFSGNFARDGGALYAAGVDIENSTFVDNLASGDSDTEGGQGGAIFTEEVLVTNSTFVGNTAANVNEAEGAEGGAIWTESGQVLFSTFLDNIAPAPVEGSEKPGDAIYKGGSSEFSVGGNIFAGSSPLPQLRPQLGYGVAIDSPIADLGGNVFSTAEITETDIYPKAPSSVFAASSMSIFGTATPALATFVPDSSGTQTIGLVSGSPALDIVPNAAPFTSVNLDQRGATRSHPADAGAFELVVTPTTAPTTAPTTTPTITPTAVLAKTGYENTLWSSLASGSLIVIGTLLAAVTSRIRRRTRNL